jgi:DNA-binding FadR family transcriptional regulator
MPQNNGDGQGKKPRAAPTGTGQLPVGLRAGSAQTRAEQLAEALDARIRSSGLAAGAPVGTLESLRAETGYAYSTVSEAVRLLRDRGVLEIRPGRGGGLFVADRGPVVRLRHTLLEVRDEPTTVADAIELRDHLEVLIDVGAARCRTDDDVAELRARLEHMRSAADWDGFMRANWALHECIARMSPNRMAAAVYAGTLGHLSGATSRFADGDPAFSEYRAERHRIHAELVEAIAAGDEAAVRAAVARHNTTT